MRRFVVAFVAFAFGPGAGSFAQPISGDIGLKVLVQPWNPVTDKDDVEVPTDNGTLISDRLAQAWQIARPELLGYVTAQLATPDGFGAGVTLRDIKIALPDPRVTVSRVAGGGGQPLSLRVDLVMAGAGLEATSTTPTPLGSFADPRCSARLDLSLSVGVVVGDGLANVLRVSEPPGGKPVAVSNFAWDSQNFPCDVLKAGVGLLGAEGLIKQRVESAAAANQTVTAFISNFQSALSGANGQIASFVPAGLVRLNAWLLGTQTRQTIALYFGAPAPVPDNSPRAAIGGSIRVTTLTGAVLAGSQGGGALPVNCDALPMTAARKTGPRPVLNADRLLLGEAPTEPLRIEARCQAGANGSATYRISGLSSGFPNILRSTGLAHSCASGQPEKSGVVLAFANWPNESILPGDLSRQFDINVTPMSVPCPPEFVRQETLPGRQPIDERTLGQLLEDLAGGRFTLGGQGGLSVNPSLSGSSVLTRSASSLGSGASDAAMRTVGGGSGIHFLNPQPLPPAPAGAQFLNLQPLPPAPAGAQFLNPQPLPPAPAGAQFLNPPEQVRVLEELVRLQQDQIRLQQDQLRMQMNLMRMRQGG